MGPHNELINRILDSCHETETGCLIWPRKIHHSGYGVMQYRHKEASAHRVVWELSKSKIPDGLLVDHICHTRSCVNPEHLRLVTPAQNVAYRSGANKNSKSGVRNVYWLPTLGKWQVFVTCRGVRYHGGTFEDLTTASIQAERLREQVYGEYAGKG